MTPTDTWRRRRRCRRRVVVVVKLLEAANVPQRVDDLLRDGAVGHVAAVLALDALDVDDVRRLVLGVENRRRLQKFFSLN